MTIQDKIAKTLDPDERARQIVEQLTLAEKIQLVTGRVGWPVDADGNFVHPPPDPQPECIIPPPGAIGSDGYVPAIERLGIPALQLCGAGVGVTNLGRHRPHGVGTVFPSSVGQTASWDPAITRMFGAALAREAANQGINVLLAGATNLAVDPRCGRIFEYHGEDPLLAAVMVSGELIGTESGGVLASIKHLAANFQETGRFFVNSVVDERALRQGELLVFELAIEWSQVSAVMCSYNKLNGTYASESHYLLTEVLKDEWQFPGWVMSDWGATHSTAPAALAGLDQEFPMNQLFGDALASAVENGKVPIARLDDMSHRILRSMFAGGIVDHPVRPAPIDFARSAEIAQHIAEQSIVLLTNSGLLPLSADVAPTIAVIGGNADRAVLSGGGSASMEPVGGDPITPPSPDRDMFAAPVWVPSSPLAAIDAANPSGRVTYTPGDDLAAAKAAAAAADVAVVFVTQWASEHWDLPSLQLPGNQDELIAAVAGANSNTVVVIQSGGAVLTPWADDVAAVLAAWYPGQRGGEAIARVLFGAVSPSAKLPITFPRSEDQLPRRVIDPVPVRSGFEVPADPPPHDSFEWVEFPYDVHYDEGLALGYKWYDSRALEPMFCFGHGLSYTTFEYRNLTCDLDASAGLHVGLTIENTGARRGAEIAQCYVSLPDGFDEPPRRLAGWAKVELDPGESTDVEIKLPTKLLAIWDVETSSWQVPDGCFEIVVGASSRAIRLSTKHDVRGLHV